MSVLPYPLISAHRKLKVLWAAGSQEYADNGRLSNGDEISEAVERFVDELCRTPLWAQELKRRAEFLKCASARNSPFRNALARVKRLKLSDSEPDVTGPSLTIRRVGELRGRLSVCEDLDVMRLTLKRTLDERLVCEGDIHVIENLAGVCKRLLHDAKRDECDGCSDLYDCYLATEPGVGLLPKGIRVCVKSIGGLIEPMKAAADSLMDWAARNSPKDAIPRSQSEADHGIFSSAASQKPSRRAAKDEIFEREAELARMWNLARDARVYKPDFAKDHGMTLWEFDALLDRVQARKRRSDNSD